MRVGLMLVPYHPLDVLRYGLAVAEEVNADSVWVPDHLLGIYHPALWPDMALAAGTPDPDAWYDSFLCLAAIGQQSDLPMGICVTDTARRRAPDVLRSALTLHHICKGGFHLGVGSGEAENLIPFGYEFSTPVSVAEEFLIELRSLLDDRVMPRGLSGRLGLPTERDDIGPMKVWVAGHGPRMLRLTGQYGDGWMPAWPMSPATYAQRRAIIAEHAQRAERPAPQSGMFLPIIIGSSRDHVAALMEADPLANLMALMSSAEVWEKYGLQHPGGPACRGLVDLVIHELEPDELRELAPQIPLELVEEMIFIGNVEQVLERVTPYARAGLELVVLVDSTGMVGGFPEIADNRGRFATLVAELAAL